MNEDPLSGHRVVAWMDGLTDEESMHVQRLSNLPTSMQVGYVWVDFNRQMNDLRVEHAEAMRASALAKNLASGAGGGLLMAVAYFAHALGWDKVLR